MIEIITEEKFTEKADRKIWWLIAVCTLLSWDLRRTSGEKTIAGYHVSATTEDGKDLKEKLIGAAVCVGY